jgi:hypothetical protein
LKFQVSQPRPHGRAVSKNNHHSPKGKNMNHFILALSGVTLLFTLAAQADQKSDLLKVGKLSDQIISGSDVRKTISVFENRDENPCAEAGISYVVKVQVRKAVRSGQTSQDRQWVDFNEYSISQNNLASGGDLTDSICME